MDWEAVGSVGGILGVVGVIATFLKLASCL